MGNNMAAFCFWDIISLFVLLAVVIGFVVRTWILRKRREGTGACAGSSYGR